MTVYNFDTEPLLKDLIIESAQDEKDYKVLSEASKDRLTEKIVEQNLKVIKKTFFKSELSTVAKTKGDVDQVKGFSDVEETIAILKKNVSNKEYLRQLDIISTGITNMRNNKVLLSRSINEGNDMVLVLYTTVVASSIMATSIILKNAMEDSKERAPIFNSFTKKSRENKSSSFIKTIEHFNALVSTGRLKQMADLGDNKDSNNIVGTVTAAIHIGGLAILGGIAVLLLVKEVIYFFYYFKNSLSAYLDNLATFVEFNASRVDNGMESSAKKQRSLAEKLSKFADKLNTDEKVASRKTTEAMDKDKKNSPKVTDETNPVNTGGAVFL